MVPAPVLLVAVVVLLFLIYKVLFSRRFNWNRVLSGKQPDGPVNRMRRSFRKSRLHHAMVKVLNIPEEEADHFEAIADKFQSFADLSDAIRHAGLESSNVIIGVDFTASNEWQGNKSFDHKSLHYVPPKSRKVSTAKHTKSQNPYQRVISAVTKVLEPFDDDNLIPAYGFGDVITKDISVFSFLPNDIPCKGFAEVEDAYLRIVERVELSGPTSYAPLIHKAIEIVESKKSYHILVIIADGQVEEDQDLKTREAIVDASYYPLSIIVVGVGDGPWDVMKAYDQKLPARKFDNFQFVDYQEIVDDLKSSEKNIELTFALHALMEIPDQYDAIKKLGLIDDKIPVSRHHSLQAGLDELKVTKSGSHKGSGCELLKRNKYGSI